MTITFVFTMFVRARASAERIREIFMQENSMTVNEEPYKKTSS